MTQGRAGQGCWEDLHPGDRFGPLGYTVTDQAVHAFRDALDLPAEPYLGQADGKDAVPPTLPATDYATLLRERLRQFIGMHARHSLRLLRPLPVGHGVVVDGEVIETYIRRGRQYLVFDYRLHDRDGVTFMANRITTTIDGYVDQTDPDAQAGSAPAPATDVGEPARAVVDAGAGHQAMPPRPRAAVHRPREWQQPISQDAMTLFAGLPRYRFGGPPAPIRNHHTDPAIARRMGLPGTVAQALHYCAHAAHLMLAETGPRFLRSGGLDFVFLLPVYAEDTVTVRLEPDGEKGEAFRIECTNQEGRLVAVGTGLVGADAKRV